MCFVALYCFFSTFVNDCTGNDFETSRIAQTGNEKSSSIGVRACSETIMHSRSKFTNEFIPVSRR